MKHLIYCLYLIAIFSAKAQPCANFYLFKPGAEVTTSHFDKKGQPNGKSVCKVSSIENTSDGKKSFFSNLSFSKSGKKQSEVKGSAQCQGNNLMLDLRNFINEEEMKAFKDMEFKAVTTYLEYPSEMVVGASLPDGIFHMDIFNSGNSFGSVDITIKNRKIVGKEEISSPAGTWPCYKITYTSQVKTKVMGVGFPTEVAVTEWYAPGFGIFKTETYTTNGKLLGSSLVTEVK